MEYYPVLQKKEILAHITWTDLGDIMLSEENLSQKDKYCMIPFIRDPHGHQIHRDRK